MPQRIAKIGRERSVKTLTRNLFVVDQQTNRATTKRAEAAILRANPQLRTAKGFKSGTRIVIPGNIRLRPTKRIEAVETSLPGVLQEASERLQIGEKAAREAFSKSNREAGMAMVTLKDRKFRQIISKQSEKGAEILKAATRRQSQLLDINKKREQQLTEIVDENMKEIAVLQKLMEKARG